jgi:Arc/MetJ family transcription regulator
MRMTIDIDRDRLAEVMRTGPFQTTSETVEAGLILVVRQALHAELLKWREMSRRYEGHEENPARGVATPPLRRMAKKRSQRRRA